VQPTLPRWLGIVFAVLLLGFALLIHADQANAVERMSRHQKQECLFNGMNERVDWTNPEERRTAWCVTRRYHVPGGIRQMLHVGDCESSWYRFASNRGNYLGLFQHDSDSWHYRVTHYEPQGWKLAQSWTNSRSQIVVTARMAHNDGDWGQWAGCA
jgi:phage-related tail fiber protein